MTYNVTLTGTTFNVSLALAGAQGGTGPEGTVTANTGATINGDLDITDKIRHVGDTNTAIRFPAADTVTVETAGVERLRVNSAGNVGIGTSNPDSLLHIASPVDEDVWFRINAGATADQRAYFAWMNYTDTSHTWLMGRNATNDFILFQNTPGQVHRLFIDGEGNSLVNSYGSGSVRINYAAFSSEANTGTGGLEVYGGGGDRLLVGSMSNGLMVVRNNTTQAINVGARIEAFAAFNDAGDIANAGAINFLKENSTSGSANFYLSFETLRAGLGGVPAEAMRIDSSGNVLIGTSATGGSRLRVSGLPTSSAGLSAGDVWNDAGTLKIV